MLCPASLGEEVLLAHEEEEFQASVTLSVTLQVTDEAHVNCACLHWKLSIVHLCTGHCPRVCKEYNGSTQGSCLDQSTSRARSKVHYQREHFKACSLTTVLHRWPILATDTCWHCWLGSWELCLLTDCTMIMAEARSEPRRCACITLLPAVFHS